MNESQANLDKWYAEMLATERPGFTPVAPDWAVEGPPRGIEAPSWTPVGPPPIHPGQSPSIPEPGTYALVAGVLVLVAVLARRRTRSQRCLAQRH